MNDHASQPDLPSGMTGSRPVSSPPSTRFPVFRPDDLKRELAIDAVIRWALLTTVLVVVWLGWYTEPDNPTWTTPAMVLAFGGWLLVGTAGARVAQRLPQITMLVEQDTDAAEAQLAKAIGRRALPRSVRILLYHRLAMVRQRQGRYAEVAAICWTILTQRMSPGSIRARQPVYSSAGIDRPGHPTMRAHLLLMFGDAALRCWDTWSTYTALAQLHRQRLSLNDLLERLLLQTRYEVAMGHTQSCLHHLEQKVRLAELMPAQPCGLMHALLAIASKRAGHHVVSQWLDRRAELLCTPEQLSTAGPASGVVGAATGHLAPPVGW